MRIKRNRKFTFLVCKLLNLDDSVVEEKCEVCFCEHFHVLPFFFILAICPIPPS